MEDCFSAGRILDLTIEDFGSAGEGIGKCGGFVVFVDKAVPGDRVLAELSVVKKNHGFGRLIDIIEYSENREEPLCESFGSCGGCDFQHIRYETELIYKKKAVNDALKRIGGLDFEIDEIIGMDEPYFYRNKAVYHISEKNGELSAGFYEKRTNRITPADCCVMFGPHNREVLRVFTEYMRYNGLRPYNVKTGKGLIGGLMTRSSSSAGDMLVSVIAEGGRLPDVGGLAKRLREVTPLRGITVIASRNGKAVNGSRVVWGDGFLLDKIGGYTFRLSDTSFFQVNSKMTQILYDKVVRLAALSEGCTVIDAYAGTGTISLYISGGVGSVIGIELNTAAVLDADENARLNGVKNVSFINGDAGRVMASLAENGVHPEAVILDPPRGGCSKSVVEGRGILKPEKIIYISCAPATLARDLKVIAPLGYRPEKGVCVDMFGRCAHVETVIGLNRESR